MSSFIGKLYLYKFLDAFKLIGPIFSLLFAANGMSVFQISVLIAVWSSSQLLFEVPMGTVADTYPRRNVLMVASMCLAVGFGLWMIGGFLFYALGMVLWGLRNALTSGTFEAFVYDELKSEGWEEQYGKVSGHLEVTFNFGLMLAAIIGGFLAQSSYNLVLILSVIGILLETAVLASFRSVKPLRSTGESTYWSILRNAVKEIHLNPKLLMLVSFISLTFGISGAADEFWGLIFQNMGLNTGLIGTLLALEFGIFMLSGFSYQFAEKIKWPYWHFLIVVLSGVLFVIFGFKPALVTLPLVFLAHYLLKLAAVKYNADLQHQVSSDQRATVLSIKGFTFEVIYLACTVGLGFISSKLGVFSVVYIWGSVVILWSLLFGWQSLRKSV